MRKQNNPIIMFLMEGMNVFTSVLNIRGLLKDYTIESVVTNYFYKLEANLAPKIRK